MSTGGRWWATKTWWRSQSSSVMSNSSVPEAKCVAARTWPRNVLLTNASVASTRFRCSTCTPDRRAASQRSEREALVAAVGRAFPRAHLVVVLGVQVQTKRRARHQAADAPVGLDRPTLVCPAVARSCDHRRATDAEVAFDIQATPVHENLLVEVCESLVGAGVAGPGDRRRAGGRPAAHVQAFAISLVDREERRIDEDVLRQGGNGMEAEFPFPFEAEARFVRRGRRLESEERKARADLFQAGRRDDLG